MELPGSATNNNRSGDDNDSGNDNTGNSRRSASSVCQALGLVLDLYCFIESLWQSCKGGNYHLHFVDKQVKSLLDF